MAVKQTQSVSNRMKGLKHDNEVVLTKVAEVQITGSNAVKAVLVTPNDTVDLADGNTKGLYVGGTGNVAVTMADGNDITFNALSVGTIHPISVKRVKATGTTATNIVAVY